MLGCVPVSINPCSQLLRLCVEQTELSGQGRPPGRGKVWVAGTPVVRAFGAVLPQQLRCGTARAGQVARSTGACLYEVSYSTQNGGPLGPELPARADLTGLVEFDNCAEPGLGIGDYANGSFQGQKCETIGHGLSLS